MTVQSPRPNEGIAVDLRPIVARERRDLSVWLFAGGAMIGAVLLFGALDAQRRAVTAPATSARTVDGTLYASATPPLYLPPELIEPAPPPPPAPPPAPFYGPAPAAAVVQSSPRVAPPAPLALALTQGPTFAPSLLAPQPEPMSSRGNVLVFDGTSSAGRERGPIDLAAGTEEVSTESSSAPAPSSDARTRSTRLGQLANTVPQGTLIPAVLETALDSTRPGHVRALVSRDVRGFDGTRVLIPRGTRLFGEYRADLSPGQNRAFVRWTRLVRPDGVAAALDSPAADALGRAGIEGRVDDHFLERFSWALLQTTLSVGAALVAQGAGDSAVIVALPGASQPLTAPGTAAQVQPTLRVDAGVSVTVFVAHDLTFPGAEARR